MREKLAFPAESKVLENYLPILIFIVLGLFVGAIALSLGIVIGPSKPDNEKNAPYECGFEAFEDSRMKFDVRYYLVAIFQFYSKHCV